MTSRLEAQLKERVGALKEDNERKRAELRANRAVTDPNLWLEDVTGDKALEWVKERNAASLEVFGDPKKTEVYSKLLSILDSKEKIPHISKIGDMFYNFWRDDKVLILV